MVVKQKSLYLFIGLDSPAKDLKLSQLKNSLFNKDVEDFNLDTLYGREVNLKNLQEKLLLLPINTARRLIVLKDAANLKQEVKDFIIKYSQSEHSYVVIVLDMMEYDSKDVFLKRIAPLAEVFRAGVVAQVSTFDLNRLIQMRKLDSALKLLNKLLSDGEKPERIMGGLRYAWEKDIGEPLELHKRLKLLLTCDIEIKKGKLKPEFALEKLVISLCSLRKP